MIRNIGYDASSLESRVIFREMIVRYKDTLKFETPWSNHATENFYIAIGI